MKKLTKEEFVDRVQAIGEAKRIFMDSGVTNNITHAFTLYQAVLADKERIIQLDSKIQSQKAPQEETPAQVTMSVDIDLEKPQCPDCEAVMRLRQATGDEWIEGYRSAWICNKCGYEGLSEKSVMRWVRELPEKGEEEVTVEGRTEKEDLSRG